MEFNFLIGKIMENNTMGKAVKEGLTVVAAAAVLSTSPASAETAQHEINKVTCTTKASCEQLSLSIQAQIDELEKKGEENLSDKEIDKYIALQEQLIATKDSTILVKDKIIAVEKQETLTEKQETLTKKDKTAQGEEIIAKKEDIKSAYAEVNSNLLSIKGSL